jgi:hypothetical protein
MFPRDLSLTPSSSGACHTYSHAFKVQHTGTKIFLRDPYMPFWSSIRLEQLVLSAKLMVI